MLEVANDGEPLPTEALPRMFDRFYRADESRHRHRDGAGSGLGLAVVRPFGTARRQRGEPSAVAAAHRRRAALPAKLLSTLACRGRGGHGGSARGRPALSKAS